MQSSRGPEMASENPAPSRKHMLLEPLGATTACDALADAVQHQSQSLTSPDATNPWLAASEGASMSQTFGVSASSATHAATNEATNPEQAIDVDEEDFGDGWEEFQKCATECSLDTKVGLSLDVAIRWNSTYTMLRDALYYRPAFERLVSYERRRYEKIAPSSTEWDTAKSLLPCLRKFFDVTELFSGTLYPTANLFFRGFCEIKLLLTDWCYSSDPIISNMANTMILKFDKYWKKSNIALAMAAVLDPRFKRKIVEFYLRKMYPYSYQAELDKFNDIIRGMYQCYVFNKPSTSAAAGSSPSAADINMYSVDDELDNFLFYTHDHDGIETNDLEKYLADPPLKVVKANQRTFDILAWWKGHRDEYPIMWQLARDVLAMQVSTIASESAFSADGRVLDPYRSRLDPSMVEALVCTRNWIAGARKGSRNVPSMVCDMEVLEAVASNLVFEEEDLIDDDEDGPEVQL